MKRKVILLDIIWLLISALLIYMALEIDAALSFILSLFFFGASYLFSGISGYSGGNPYKGMMISPQPNEIEYSSYKIAYEKEMEKKRVKGKANWLILILGVITFVFTFYLVIF